MAVVRATAEDERDHLSYIEPFVTDRLRAWPGGENVEPKSLSRALCQEFGFPQIPMHVSNLLIRRALARDQLVETEHGTYLVNRCVVDAAADLREKKAAMLAQTAALAEKVAAYARETHELEWTTDDAYGAIERLCEDFGADLALARREGLESMPDSTEGENHILLVVHGFARRALERDPTSFDALVALVQGTMLTNALYFEDTRKTVNRLAELRVYLDTRPLLRALGAAEPEVAEASREMLALLSEFKVKKFVFAHTIQEMSGILDAIARALRRGRPGFRDQGKVAGFNREAIDALVKQGVTAAEIESMNAELEERLRALGVYQQETPRHVEKTQIDEVEFEKVLREVVRYGSTEALQKDLRSLTAIDRLRGGTHPRDLAHTRALFVTTNGRLVHAAREFFATQGRGARVGHAMLDVALTAQLWVRSSNRKPDTPRKMLIADCYAALAPSPELWARWVAAIGRLRDLDQLSDEQVQALIYHQQAKVVLFEYTHGDPDLVDDDMVAEVLEKLERELRRPIEEQVTAERQRADAAEAEIGRLADEVETLKAWKKDREVERAARKALFGRLRHVGGHVGGALAVLAFVVLGVTGVIDSKVAWASASVLLVLVAAASWAWGTRRPVSATAWKACIGAGAVTALWFAVWAFVPDHPAPAKLHRHPSLVRPGG